MATIIKLAQHGNSKGLMQKEAISAANKMGALIISNKEFDKRLVLSDTWKSEENVYPAWTGTLVAYGENGAKLGKAVKYTDSSTGTTYLFEVPKEYQNEKNAILVVNHGFLADGQALILPKAKGNTVTYDITDMSQIELLQKFPSSNGWYGTGNRFGIPIGERFSSSISDARFLYRAQVYVGLLSRGYRIINLDRRDVGAYYLPSDRLGALISAESARPNLHEKE